MGRPNKYYWRRWFGYGSFEIKQGMHYHCTHNMMAQQIRNAATRYGCYVKLECTRDGFKVGVDGFDPNCTPKKQPSNYVPVAKRKSATSNKRKKVA